jgi:hypothetical protein
MAQCNYTQRLVSTVTWLEALAGCRTKDMTGLRQSNEKHLNGRLFVAEYGLPGLFGSTTAQTVALTYSEGPNSCWDVLLCDVDCKGWLIGQDPPEIRACNRVLP